MNKREQAILDSMIILIDTREQDTAIKDWLERKGKSTRVQKLDYGDFSYLVPKNEELGILEDVNMSSEVVIERKANIEEIIGNICDKGGARLEKELKNCPAYMTLVIEDKYDKACLGTYNSNFNRKALLGKLATYEHKFGVPVKFKSKESMPVHIYTHFLYHLRLKILDGFFDK